MQKELKVHFLFHLQLFLPLSPKPLFCSIAPQTPYSLRKYPAFSFDSIIDALGLAVMFINFVVLTICFQVWRKKERAVNLCRGFTSAEYHF